MKKLLLVFVLAAALVGLLATTALAQPVLQDGAYVALQDGSWYQVTGGEQVASYDPGMPIPGGQSVWLFSAWAAFGLGHLQGIGNAIVYKVSIDGTPVVATKAASKALWGLPYPSRGSGPPFNPQARVKPWVVLWLYPVALGPGTYEVAGTETYTHPLTNLAFTAENRPGPFIYPAGTTPFGPWELVLQ